LPEADAGVLPVDWMHVVTERVDRGKSEAFLRETARAGKPVILFFCHDAPLEFDWPGNATVLRIAVRRSRKKPREFIIPQWSRDYLEADLGGELAIRRKRDIPVVGFCGFAPPVGMRPGAARWKECLRLLAHRLGAWRIAPDRMAHAARSRAILRLLRSPEVETRFLLRGESAFDNPIGAFLPGGSVEAAAIRRREFVENIAGSDYVLCARGWANCSLRFYEALSLGRIPLLVDTESVLPWEGHIDWGRHCATVPEAEIGRIGRRLRAFHDPLADEGFEDLQRSCRDLFEHWLSPHGFFGNLPKLLAR
jgi:hypothetical protein